MNNVVLGVMIMILLFLLHTLIFYLIGFNRGRLSGFEEAYDDVIKARNGGKK